MNEKKKENLKWFKQAKYGMMIHWGLYSLPAGEWNGKRMPYIGEWIQSYFRIKNQTYSKLATAFNPLLFNADDWVNLAIDSGMQYMVVTSKHHDGFAMFKSNSSDYNIYDATPFKKDVISELAQSCYKHNLKFGLYYSQDLDWSDPNGGGYTSKAKNFTMSWTNDWDYPDSKIKDYSICFESKIAPQVEEILKNYGELCLIWFDTPCTILKQQSKHLYDLIEKYQPGCLINSRIGNGVCDYTSLGDNEIPDEYLKEGLFETPATLNDTWGYKSYDQNWKDAEEVLRLKNHLNSRGINYLLNVGSDYLGRIPAPSQDILLKTGKIMRNQEG